MIDELRELRKEYHIDKDKMAGLDLSETHSLASGLGRRNLGGTQRGMSLQSDLAKSNPIKIN